jgi:FAD/FMN-containing dehydrogenase
MNTLTELRNKVKGKTILQGEEGYDNARSVWNGMIDKHPSAIVYCKDASDVANVVRYARENNLLLAVRGGGHNVAGLGTCDGGIVLDLSMMKGIQVDSVNKVAKAEAGLTWGEFDKATQTYGLATTGGLISSTGIAGLTLGGGIGWLVRKYGMTIDNLISVEIVTADGKMLRASEKENQDLFWAIRGGGGNFGVVTSFEYSLHKVGPEVYGGALFYPLEMSYEVMEKYSSWQSSLPDEISTLLVFMTAPPLPFIPSELQGTKMVSIALCHVGSKEEGERIVAPMRALKPAVDIVGPIPYVALQSAFDASAPRGIKAYWKTSYPRYLNSEFFEILYKQASSLPSPFSMIHIHQLGGAINRKSKEDTAFWHRDAPFVLNIIGFWMDPADTNSSIEWVRQTWNAVKPLSTEGVYSNFMVAEDSDQVKLAYGGNYSKLANIKKKYDPTNLFRVNQNIKPA